MAALVGSLYHLMLMFLGTSLSGLCILMIYVLNMVIRIGTGLANSHNDALYFQSWVPVSVRS